MDAYGLSEIQLDRLSFDLPGGWKPSSVEALQSPPHEHDWAPSFSVVDAGVDLVVTRIGDGAIPNSDLSFQTTIELLEDRFFGAEEPVKGQIEFYGEDGDPLELTVNGITGAVFPFELADGELKRFVTSGTGEVKTGWAHVHSDQVINAASSFGLRNSSGDVLTDVGVGVGRLGAEFTIFADSMGDSRTAVAVTNGDTEVMDIEFELNDTSGNQVAVRQRTVVPRGHLGIFLDELFEGVVGIDEFEGSVVIRSLEGPQLVATESIGQAPRLNHDSAANPKTSTAGDSVTPSTVGQELAPPRSLSVQREGQDHLVLSWELPQPPDGGGGPGEFIDETEPNDFDDPDTLEIGQTARGTIDPDFDEDVWRFEGTAGLNIVIDVEAESLDSVLDSVLVLFLDRDLDEDGFPDQIGFNDDFGESLDSRLEVTLPETSAYLIQILDAFDEGAPSFFYEMSLSLATQASSGGDLGPTTAGPTLQGFNIYRSVAPASPQVDPADRIENVGPEMTRFRDDEVQESTTYRYLVTAAYDQGGSPPSNQVEITIPGSREAGPPFAALTLRATGNLLTSLPAVPPPPADSQRRKLAFPHVGDGVFGGLRVVTTAIIFNNTPNPASGMISFFNSDTTPMEVTIEKRTASTFEFALDPGGVSRMVTSGTGQGVGWARVTMDQPLSGSGIFQILEVEPGVASAGGTFTQGTGVLEGSPSGGLSVELRLLDKQPFTEVGDDADQFFFLPPGLISSPSSARTVTVKAEFTSVSTSLDHDKRIVRKTTQEIAFVAADPAKANLEAISPLFVQPRQALTLFGTNLGQDSKVVFSNQDGIQTEAPVFQIEGSNLAIVPSGAADGEIRVDNGFGLGNAYEVKVLFGPTFETRQVVGEGLPGIQGDTALGIQFAFRQPALQVLLTEHTVEMYGVSADFSTLQPEAVVGSGSIEESGTSFDLVVESAEPSSAILQVLQSSSRLIARIQVLEIPDSDGSVIGLAFIYEPEEREEEAVILDQFSTLTWIFKLNSFPFLILEGQSTITSFATMLSTPIDERGNMSQLSVVQSSSLDIE